MKKKKSLKSPVSVGWQEVTFAGARNATTGFI